MKKILIVIISALLLVGCQDNEPQKNETNTNDAIVIEETKNVLVDVNGHPITIKTFNKYYAMQSYDFEKEYGESVWNIEQNGRTMREIRQDQTIDYLIRISLIESYVTERGFDVDEVKINEAFDKYMDSIEGDDELLAYYKTNGLDEEFLKRFLKDQYFLSLYSNSILEDVMNDATVQSELFENRVIRYKTRHILLETQESVNEVLTLLNDEENPSDFSDIARLYSIHSTSAVTGGDLGYRLIGTMPEAYETAALTTELYTVSEPIKTEFGYHIIFVDDRQMLQDMIDSGMPEEEIKTYQTEITQKFADAETVRVFEGLRNQAEVLIYKELLIEE